MVFKLIIYILTLLPNLSQRNWYLFGYMGITCKKKALEIIVRIKYIDNKRYYMVNNELLSHEKALNELGQNMYIDNN